MKEVEGNLFPVDDQLISRKWRESFLNQRAAVYWMTGLSGSGKTTIAKGVEKKLSEEGFFIKVLDGDNIRVGLNKGLTFSIEDRVENIRRISEVSKLFLDTGIITIASFISPTEAIRTQAKTIIGDNAFYQVFINTPLEVCEQRDVKGLYKKARAGQIKGFSGIDSPFESPKYPDLEIQTASLSVADAVTEVCNFIKERSSLSLL